MTTPKPERMTDATLEATLRLVVDATAKGHPPVVPEEVCSAILDVAHEARRARSGEEQAGRERDEAVEQWHKDQARIDALTNDTIDLSLEVDEWREHFEDVLCGFAFDLGGRSDMGFVPCAHCGWCSEIVLESEINAVIREHIKTCPEHPMRAVEAERDAARMLAREVASELGEARAWAAKVEAAFGDAQRDLSTILGRAPDEKLDDAAWRVMTALSDAMDRLDGYREAAKRLADTLYSEHRLSAMRGGGLDAVERIANGGGPVDDADRAYRAVKAVERLRADVEMLKDRLVTLEAGRSGAVRLAEARALAAMRGWRQLPESVRGAVLTEASFLASAIEDYASAVEQDNLGAAERTKKAMEGRNV